MAGTNAQNQLPSSEVWLIGEHCGIINCKKKKCPKGCVGIPLTDIWTPSPGFTIAQVAETIPKAFKARDPSVLKAFEEGKNKWLSKRAEAAQQQKHQPNTDSMDVSDNNKPVDSEVVKESAPEEDTSDWSIVARSRGGPKRKITYKEANPTKSDEVKDKLRAMKIPGHLAKMWKKTKACRACGGKHEVENCNHFKNFDNNSMSQSGTAARAVKRPAPDPQAMTAAAATAANPLGGVPGSAGTEKLVTQNASGGPSKKRGRAEVSGQTPQGKRRQPQPPTNKPEGSKFQYADIAKRACTVIIVRQETKSHISRAEFRDLLAQLEEEMCSAVDGGNVPMNLEHTMYTRKFAAIAAEGSEAAAALAERITILSKGTLQGISLKHLTELRKEMYVLTGMVRGVTAVRSDDKIATLIRGQWLCFKLRGTFKQLPSWKVKDKTSGQIRDDAKIIRIQVDEEAMADLEKIDFTIRIGTTGRVKLNAKKKIDEYEGDIAREDAENADNNDGDVEAF